MAIYLLGNKVDKDSGAIVPADGMREEFAIATENGVYPVPVGLSGHVAADLWREVHAEMVKYYGEHAKAVEEPFKVLNNATAADDDLIAAIVRILQIIAPK